MLEAVGDGDLGSSLAMSANFLNPVSGTSFKIFSVPASLPWEE